MKRKCNWEFFEKSRLSNTKKDKNSQKQKQFDSQRLNETIRKEVYNQNCGFFVLTVDHKLLGANLILSNTVF